MSDVAYLVRTESKDFLGVVEPVVRLKYRFLGILYGWVLGRVDPDVFSILDFFGLSFCLEGGDWGVLFCIYLDVFSVIKCLYVSKKKKISCFCLMIILPELQTSTVSFYTCFISVI